MKMIDTHQQRYLHRVIKPSSSLSLEAPCGNLTEKAGTRRWGDLGTGTVPGGKGTSYLHGGPPKHLIEEPVEPSHHKAIPSAGVVQGMAFWALLRSTTFPQPSLPLGVVASLGLGTCSRSPHSVIPPADPPGKETLAGVDFCFLKYFY